MLIYIRREGFERRVGRRDFHYSLAPLVAFSEPSVLNNFLHGGNPIATEMEKEQAIQSLTCINQALIKCTPSSLTINDVNQTTEIAVRGQENMGCNVSIRKFDGEIMSCPLPTEYITDIQKKFMVNNYDSSIITDLIVDMNAEVNSGDKSGGCSVTR